MAETTPDRFDVITFTKCGHRDTVVVSKGRSFDVPLECYRCTKECYRGEGHVPHGRPSYGDGHLRVSCTRCGRVLAGEPVPPPDLAAIDYEDD